MISDRRVWEREVKRNYLLDPKAWTCWTVSVSERAASDASKLVDRRANRDKPRML